MAFNYARNLGVKDAGEIQTRDLVRDTRFRKALAYATDRDAIAQSIMKGPFIRGYAGGLYPGAPDFDKATTVYYPHDVESAKSLLAEIGLKDSNGDGILEFTSGALAGKPVVLQVLASEDAAETQTVAEALINQWKAVGIQLNMKTTTSAVSTDLMTTAVWDLTIDRGGQAFALPFVNPANLAPLSKAFNWHREGDKPRELMDFEPELVAIMTKYKATTDAAERKKLLSQYQNTFTKNVYELGVISTRYGLGLAKRSKNVPPATPVFMYQWVEDAIMLEQIWTPVDQQLKQLRPETVPTYS